MAYCSFHFISYKLSLNLRKRAPFLIHPRAPRIVNSPLLKPCVGTDTALEDFTFLQDMIAYKNFAPTFAERAFKELAKLECFLSEETVVFALYSDYSELTNKKKKINVKSLQETSRPSLRLSSPKHIWLLQG